MSDWTDLLAQLSPWAMLPLFFLTRRSTPNPDAFDWAKQFAPLLAKPNALPLLAEIARVLLAHKMGEQLPAGRPAGEKQNAQ